MPSLCIEHAKADAVALTHVLSALRPFAAMHTSKQRYIFAQPEPNLWAILVVEVREGRHPSTHAAGMHALAQHCACICCAC